MRLGIPRSLEKLKALYFKSLLSNDAIVLDVCGRKKYIIDFKYILDAVVSRIIPVFNFIFGTAGINTFLRSVFRSPEHVSNTNLNVCFSILHNDSSTENKIYSPIV